MLKNLIRKLIMRIKLMGAEFKGMCPSSDGLWTTLYFYNRKEVDVFIDKWDHVPLRIRKEVEKLNKVFAAWEESSSQSEGV